MGLSDFLFPKTCLGCKKSGKYICTGCVKKVRIPKPTCCVCEKPAVDFMTHVRCKTPLGLDAVVSVWNYEGVARQAILKLKYKFAFEVADELADSFCERIKKEKIVLPKESVLIPIPLYWYRKNWRGFNQVEEVGKLVASKLGWKFYPNILVRKSHRRPQTELKGDKRQENIRGVFSLNSKYQKTYLLFTKSHLLLFDDVYTTGSTLKEAGKVLKRNGAKNVWGLTLAR